MTPPGATPASAKMGIMAVEMEAAALYCTAAYLGKRALRHLLDQRQPHHR